MTLEPRTQKEEIIEISVNNGFKKARAMLLVRPYMLCENYKKYISDILHVNGEEVKVENQFAIIFGDYKNREGKFLTEEQLATYFVQIPNKENVPGILQKQDSTNYLVKEIGEPFYFITDDNQKIEGSKYDYLVAVPSTKNYRIFSKQMFMMNFKFIGE